MSLVKSTREEAILPEVPCPSLPDLEPPGVVVMHSAKSASQRIGVFGHRDDVDMVHHQAISEHSQPSLVRVVT
jgi:hypothetical protein